MNNPHWGIEMSTLSSYINNLKKNLSLHSSRRSFLTFCLRLCKYLFLGSILGFLNAPHVSFSTEGSPPRPPSFGKTTDPSKDVNAKEVRKRTDLFIDDFVKELEKSGVTLTPEEIKQMKNETYKYFESILKKNDYRPKAPTGLRIITP